MKDIKFRIWDKENKKMINLGRIDIADGSCSPTIFGNVFYDYWNDVELMQYVGCKDKNNKEIYEGDIVKTKEHMGQIIYSKGMFFIDVKGDFYLPIYNVSEFMEVIGNIYENPELIINE